MTVLIETRDDIFVQNLTRTLLQWGLGVFHKAVEQDISSMTGKEEIEVVLLDIRSSTDNALGRLQSIRENLPAVEIILINSHDNIRASMSAMQAGANDEILFPCDTGILRKKITDALKHRKKMVKKKRGMSFFTMLSESMAAATFAQSGEFDAAIDYMNEARKASEKQDRENKKRR